jgi:hypothetical protein
MKHLLISSIVSAASAQACCAAGFGCSVLEQASNGVVKTASYIWLLMLLKLGNVLPSEAIG